jgi:polysaccharide biosynthesis transport protein
MSLTRYWFQLRRWALLAVLPALVVGVLGYAYTKHEPRTYQASTTLYIQPASNPLDTSSSVVSTQASLIVAPTYLQMITNPVLARAVNRMMAAKYPGYRLQIHTVSASQPPGTVTQLLTITVGDVVPARAADAANALAKAFIARVSRLNASRFKTDAQSLQTQLTAAQNSVQSVTQQISTYKGSNSGLSSLRSELSADQGTYAALLSASQQFKATRDSATNAVSTYASAETPTAPIGPHPTRSAILFAFVAFLLCAGGLYAYNWVDDSLRSPEELEELVGAPILGTVQRFDASKLGTQLVTTTGSRSQLSEEYRLIRTNIQFTNVDEPPRKVLVTSPSPREGKSTTASNLAVVFAEGGKRVTIVDADLRRPSVHRIFQVAGGREMGLTSLLLSQHLNGSGQQKIALPNLTVVPAGHLPPNPADLLGSHRMEVVLDYLQESADIVIVDSPPVLAVADAAILAASIDGIILVIDPAQTKRRDVVRTRETLEAVGGRILGVVINRLSSRGSFYYYYYSSYGYGYGYGYGTDKKGDAASPVTKETTSVS